VARKEQELDAALKRQRNATVFVSSKRVGEALMVMYGDVGWNAWMDGDESLTISK
jgi:hypothetical protein